MLHTARTHVIQLVHELVDLDPLRGPNSKHGDPLLHIDLVTATLGRAANERDLQRFEFGTWPQELELDLGADLAAEVLA